MRKLFDFRCSEGHITERLVESDVKRVRCECGKESKRLISPVRSQLPPNAGFPDADARWVRSHEARGGKK